MNFLKNSTESTITIAIVFFCALMPVSAYAQADKPSEKASPKPDASAKGATDESAEKRSLPKLEPGAWEPLFELGESIYPSVVISTATMKEGLWEDKQHIGDPWGTIGVAVRGVGNECPVKVEISGGNFIRPSAFSATLADKDTVYCVYPALKYDYEKLLAVKQTVPETLSFFVTVGDKTYPEKTVRVQVRPVNECVYNFDDSTGVTNDISYLFAAYVNENHPFVSEILKDAIASGKVSSFSGYQDDKNSVMAEIRAIWNTLKARGMHYSTMPASADDDNPYLGSQYVRLLGESINYSQANCVDGSVMMASVLRKIGLDVNLVEMPDHMFISVSLDPEGKDVIFIETTALSDETLEEAVKDGYEQYMENKKKFDSEKDEDQDYNIINIQSARVMGIMPIKDTAVD